MPRSVVIRHVQRGGGQLHLIAQDKQGYHYTSAAQGNAALDEAQEAVTKEVLMLLAVRQVGLPQVQTLEGKRVTLNWSLTIENA